MNNKIKGVAGWLLFFVIILTIIRPIYLFYDVVANPSFYTYYNGVYDLSSLLSVAGLAIWGIVIGISIWRMKDKAIIWAKEYLIIELVVNIAFMFLFLNLYSAEEQEILFTDLFRSLIFFGIWFSYLCFSERVKNTFKKTEIQWQRLGTTFLIVLGFLFLIIIAGLFLQNIETGTMNVEGSSNEVIQSFMLNAEMANYHEFEDQGTISDVSISFQSNLPVTVFLIKSEEDYNNFIEGGNYEIYDNCFVDERFKGEINCTISTGGIVVLNYNQKDVNYTLTFR